MIEGLSRNRRNIALGVLAVLAVWFAWSIRSVLNPVLLGYLCAFIAAPSVAWIQARGFRRRTAVNLTFVVGFTLLALLSVILVWQFQTLALDIYADVKASRAEAATEQPAVAPPDATAPVPTPPQQETFDRRLQGRLDEFNQTLQGWGLPAPELSFDTEGLKVLAGKFLQEYGDDTVETAGRGVRFLSRFLGKLSVLIGLFVLLPLYAYYFLFVGEDVNRFFARYLPKQHRARFVRVASEIGQMVANFFRGRLSVCFLKGLFLSIGLLLADVPYSFLFGMLSGFLSIIPFFGPFIGFLFAFLIAILDHGVFSALLRTGIVFGLGETIEGYVLIPKILGDSLGLHPLVVFVALLAGGAALGMLGIIVALPLTAAIVILAREFVLPALGDWADEEGPPA